MRRSKRGILARILLAGVRRRSVAFIGLALLSAGAIVVSVCAPLLLRAAQQSSLAAVASPSAPAVRLTLDGAGGIPDAGYGRRVLRPASLWRASLPVSTSGDAAAWGSSGATRLTGHLVSSQNCAGVSLSSGRCPARAGEVVVPDDSDARIGEEVQWAASNSVALTVVGTYRQTPIGGPFRDAAQARALRVVDRASRTDDLLVSGDQLKALQGGFVITVPVSLRRALRLEDVAAVRASLVAARRTMAGPGLSLAAPILPVIAEEQATAGAATLIALALAAQTLAVAWAVQALFIGGIARSRAGEWGVARLRGFRPSRRLRAIFAEPVLAVLIGAIAGWVAAILISQAIVSATSGGLVQPFEALPLAVGGLAVLGCLVALVLASARSATLPLAQLLRERAEPERIGRLSLVAQSGVVLATALVLYSIASGGTVTGPQLPLLAPALIAVTIGLLALRLIVPLLRRRTSGTPRSLSGLIAGRRVVRTPSLLATVVVMCVAVALATSALQTALVSGQLQHRRAQAAVGAARVLDVAVPTGVDLIAAVRRADPGGHAAMAAMDLASGSGPQRVVAVDTARLAAVSSWSTSWAGTTPAALQRRLAPRTGSAVRLRGSRIELVVEGAQMQPGPRGEDLVALRDLELTLRVQNRSGFQSISLGRLASRTYTAALPCADGCRVVDLMVTDRGPISPWATQFVIASMRTDQQGSGASSNALVPGSWRRQLDTTASLNRPPRVEVSRVGTGMQINLSTSESRAGIGIAPRDAPQVLPALAGPSLRVQTVDSLPGAVTGSGLAFESLLVHPIGRASILPRSLADGVLVDLSTIEKISNPRASQAQAQVWLSAAAGPSTVRALQQAGLRVEGEQRLSTVESRFLNGTVPRVAGQGAAIGLIGLGLALLALLVAQLLRRPALRATDDLLRLSGARPGRLRRIAAAEAALPAAAGALLGAAAGSIGALVVLPSLPLGAGAGALPPLDFAIAPLALLLPLGAALVLIAVIAISTHPGRSVR